MWAHLIEKFNGAKNTIIYLMPEVCCKNVFKCLTAKVYLYKVNVIILFQ